MEVPTKTRVEVGGWGQGKRRQQLEEPRGGMWLPVALSVLDIRNTMNAGGNGI